MQEPPGAPPEQTADEARMSQVAAWLLVETAEADARLRAHLRRAGRVLATAQPGEPATATRTTPEFSPTASRDRQARRGPAG